jgi:hypothetical protein
MTLFLHLPQIMVCNLMKKANPIWQVILGLSRYGGLRNVGDHAVAAKNYD